MKHVAIVALFASVAVAQPLEEAKTHFAAGRFAEAVASAREVSKRDAGYARARYLMGEIALVLGDTDGARSAFREALDAKPDAEPILTGLGRALVAAGEHAEAVKVLTRAVEKAPKSGRAHCFLGIALRHDTLGEKGAREIARGVKLAPADPEVARAATLYWLDEEQPDKAAKAANAFRRKRKKHPVAHFLTALTLEREKEYDDAIDAYLKAIKLDDKFLDAHKNLAILCIAQNPMYRNQKRTALAMKHFTRYRELGGKDPRIAQIHDTLKAFLKRSGGG